jgi:hypothetical protein
MKQKQSVGEQKYATKKFNSLKAAESFKEKVGSNFTIKEVNGKFCIRFKIDKSIPRKEKVDGYSKWYDEKSMDGSFAYNASTDDF